MKSLQVLMLIAVASLAPASGYLNSEYGFSIDPPEGWSLNEDFYVLALFMAPDESGFPPRLSINVFDRTRTELGSIALQIKSGYISMFNDFLVLEEGDETVQGLPVYRMVCTWKQGIYNIKMTEIIIQKIGRFYDLAYIAREEDYNANLPLFNNSLATLSIFDPLYSNPEMGLEIFYPSGWALDEETLRGVTIFYGPEQEGFLTNVVLTSQAWGGDLQGYANDQETTMVQTLTDLQIIQEGELGIPAGRCSEIIYGYKMPGPLEIRARAIMIVKGGKAYCVVYTALPVTYEMYNPQFEGMISTLSIAEHLLLVGLLLGIMIHPSMKVKRHLRQVPYSTIE